MEENNLSNSLVLIRNRIFLIHSRLEEQLETLILSSIISPISNKVNFKQYSHLVSVSENLFAGMSFYRKMEVTSGMKILKGKLLDNIKWVNQVQNWFAHPNKYRVQLQMLDKNKKDYRDILFALYESREELNKLLDKKDVKFSDNDEGGL